MILINHDPFYNVCLDRWYIWKESYLSVLFLKLLVFLILDTWEEIKLAWL